MAAIRKLFLENSAVEDAWVLQIKEGLKWPSHPMAGNRIHLLRILFKSSDTNWKIMVQSMNPISNPSKQTAKIIHMPDK